MSQYLHDLPHALLATLLYAALGFALLLLGFVLVDALTPGRLRHQIWVERNRNAALVLSSALLGVGAIVFTAIMTSYADLAVGLASTAVFAVLGLALMALAFWLLDVLTPGQLRDMVVDPNPHPAVWVVATTNVVIAGIICATIT